MLSVGVVASRNIIGIYLVRLQGIKPYRQSLFLLVMRQINSSYRLASSKCRLGQAASHMLFVRSVLLCANLWTLSFVAICTLPLLPC